MRRIGSTPQQRGSATGQSCPDVFELDGGDYLVIGKIDSGNGVGGSIRASSFAGVSGASIGPDERAVIVPRDCIVTAARQIVGEDAGGHDGKHAYAAYSVIVDGLNYRGEPMPEWDDLPVKIRAAWGNAAMGVRNRALMQASDKIRDRLIVDGVDKATASHAAALIDPRDPKSLDSE
ncbi:hypothetical protein [Streptomyces sp. OK228]|uniref:hypothetical protein n=1 Tax=Streptomyces sp. OK228 TaxID=1882786 RepID=UPI000BCB2C77|nr:hypothetical protein [Streptomyces sp. OK228]SOE25641.1 hypothetical protein SAMN05442782_2384 [Streptomyces sp. OK228]